MNSSTPHTPSQQLQPIIRFSQQITDLITEIGHIKKVRVENDEMDYIWDISADEVEEKGEVCYMNPCIAKTLYTIKKLKECYPAEMIALGIEYLTYTDTRNSFHFFAELHQDNDVYILDFPNDNIVLFYKGPYKNRNQKRTIISNKIETVPATSIQNNDNIFDIAKRKGVNAEALREQLAAHIQHLKKANTLKRWEKYCKSSKNGHLRLINEIADISAVTSQTTNTLHLNLSS